MEGMNLSGVTFLRMYIRIKQEISASEKKKKN